MCPFPAVTLPCWLCLPSRYPDPTVMLSNSLQCHCTVVVLPFCPTTLTFRCPASPLLAVPLRCYHPSLLSHYLDVPLPCCPTALLSHYLGIALSHFPTAPLLQCPASVLLSRCPRAQSPNSYCPIAPMSNNPSVPLTHCFAVPHCVLPKDSLLSRH
jgi:hypothetical protein